MQEDIRTEFKREFSKTVIKSVVAFANTNGGDILIGVDDDGRAIGVDDVDGIIRSTTQQILDGIRPVPSSIVSLSPEKMDGKDIIRLHVEEGAAKPYYLRDKGMRPEGVCIRVGAMSTPADESMILKMVREWASMPFESCRSMKQDLTFDATGRLFSEAGLRFGEEQMRSLGMISDGLYTNLAYLLSDQCETGIKIASFDDESKETIRGRMEFHGSVLAQFGDALEYLRRYNPITTSVDGGAKHKDVQQFPAVAIREAVLNAIIHRDYSIAGPILISVFDDRMEIVSLGGLNKDIGMDDIRMGISSPRNQNLAAVFFRLHMVESYGTGIPKIIGCYSDSVRSPDFMASGNAFKVVLPKLVNGQGPRAVSAYREVLALMDSKGSVTRQEVEDSLGVSRAKANESLKRMVSEGCIRREGSARATRYLRVRLSSISSIEDRR